MIVRWSNAFSAVFWHLEFHSRIPFAVKIAQSMEADGDIIRILRLRGTSRSMELWKRFRFSDIVWNFNGPARGSS